MRIGEGGLLAWHAYRGGGLFAWHARRGGEGGGIDIVGKSLIISETRRGRNLNFIYLVKKVRLSFISNYS